MSAGAALAPHRSAARPADARLYTAYGMTIASDLPLPELETATEGARVDLTIRLGPSSGLWETLGATDFRFSDDRQFLAWPRVGAFTLTGDHTITIDPYPGVGDQLLRMPLLGPVLAVLLHQRGRLVLHASAVRVGDGCVILLGDKGAGKSTTAAALVAAGHDLMTDDVVALDLRASSGPIVEPGFPQMKLDPHSPLGGEVGEAFNLPTPAKGFPKDLRRLTARFTQEPAPPRRIYVLGRGPTAASEPLGGVDALTALMRFSYMVRFADRLRSGSDASAHFRQCAAVADLGIVRRLTAPLGVERLGEAVRLIEQDVAVARQRP